MEKLTILKAFLITQMNHWILFTIGFTALGVAKIEELYIPHFILLSILPFLSYLCRRYSNKFLFYMTLQILSVAVIAFPLIYTIRGNVVSVFVFIVYLIGYAVASFVLRVVSKDRLEKPITPVVAAVLSVLTLLLQNYQGSSGLDRYYIVVFLLFVGLYYIYYYLEHFQHFIAVNDSTVGHIPKRDMFRTGIRLVGLFAAFGMLVLFVASHINFLSGIFYQIKEGFLYLLGLLFGLFDRGGKEIEILEQIALPPEGEMLQFEQGESSWFGLVLERLLIGIGICLMVAGTVYAFVKLFLFLWERFRQRLRTETRVLDVGIDIREKVDIIRRSSERKGVFEFLNPRERIRRIYKKRVLEGKSLLVGDGERKLLNLYTARECGRVLDALVLAGLYEKARYSEEECTVEDVRAAKK